MRTIAPVLSFLLFALWLASPAGADGDVRLPDVTVVASPGYPEGLHAFLPERQAPKPLAWPLPEGPLLVLGLPDEDPTAFALATMWGILPPDGDLHGGYVRVAWHDGHRPLAVILGADAAALYAARFELETTTTPTGGPPSTDFTKPPAPGVLQVEGRWHHTRPHYRVRAVLPIAEMTEGLLETLVAGRANQAWIYPTEETAPQVTDLLPKLRRYGIEPVLVVPMVGPDALAPERAARRDADGVRRFILYPWNVPVAAARVSAVGEALRATGPVDEIIVIGEDLSIAGTSRVTDSAGARAACRTRAGPPTYFLEDWAWRSRTPVPSRPRGRPLAFGRRLAGIVAWDGPGLEAILQDAWDGPTDAPDAWEAHLLPLLPSGATNGRAFLREARTRLAKAAKATYGAVPWMAPLADLLTRRLAHVPEDAILVPRVPARITPDGILDEAAWRWAARFSVTRADGTPLEMLAVADGKRLAVAFRAPSDLAEATFWIGPPASDASGLYSAFGGRVEGSESKHGVFRRTQAGVLRRTATGVVWEGVLDHFDLEGDAHPTRVFGLRAYVKDARNGELLTQQLATLVLVP